MEHWYIGFRAVGSVEQIIQKIKRANLGHIFSSRVCYEKNARKGGEFYFFIGVTTPKKPDSPDSDEEITDDLKVLLKKLDQLGFSKKQSCFLYFDDIKNMTKTVEIHSLRKLKIYSYKSTPIDPFAYFDSDEGEHTSIQNITPKGYQDLLYVMSLRHTGTWQSFQDLCRAIGLDATGVKSRQIIHRLQLLGHVELIDHGKKWAIAPPCLVEPDVSLDDQIGHALFLAGQRSKSIVNFLSHYVHHIKSHPHANAPEAIHIRFYNQEKAGEFASQHRYHLVGNIARKMAESLPTLSEWESSLTPQLIITAHYDFSEWRDDKFEALDGLPTRTGLYQLSPRNLSGVPKQTFYYNADQDRWLKADWYGLRYLMLKRTNTTPEIHYHTQKNEVIIRRDQLLPYVYQKALVLASGFLPTHRGQFVHYLGVSPYTIQLLATKLEAELIEHKG